MLANRMRESTSTYANAAQAAESDRSRVLFSAPFRRMQEKAQVFSLEDNAAVRSRLTHSLEVAHIGRYLARSVIAKAGDSLKYIGILDEYSEEAAVTIVEVACLLHDIGNPPFGHFGEKVIKHWFENNRNEFKSVLNVAVDEVENPKSIEFDKFYRDFIFFDGNPQGFRIVSKLQWNHDENGLNLTVSQLASLLKYDCSPSDVGETGSSKKKAGYFYVDEHVIKSIWYQIGGDMIRHPLSYLMEAADDIAYCLSDIEDGIEKGLITGIDIDKAINESSSKLLKSIYEEAGKFDASADDRKLCDHQVYLQIKTRVTNKLVNLLSDKYIENVENISKESTNSLVDMTQDAKIALGVFRELAGKHLYNSRVVRENEIIANRVITGLLDGFKPLLLCNKKRFEHIKNMNSKDSENKSISVEQSMYRQLATKFIKVYEQDLQKTDVIDDEEIKEWILRAHLVVDHISGMTDKFALAKFRLVCAP